MPATKDLKITLRNIELKIITLLLLLDVTPGKMEQRGMTHSRKQALANHAIAGVHNSAHTPLSYFFCYPESTF